MLQMYQEFPAGPLQDKELTKMISKSIAANYGDVPALPNNGEDVRRFLALVTAEVHGKSEVEILIEMKATLEILTSSVS